MTKATTKILKQKLTQKCLAWQSEILRLRPRLCRRGNSWTSKGRRGGGGALSLGNCTTTNALKACAGPLSLNWKEIVQKTLEPSLPHHHHRHQRRRHYHHYCLGCFECLSKVASGSGLRHVERENLLHFCLAVDICKWQIKWHMTSVTPMISCGKLAPNLSAISTEGQVAWRTRWKLKRVLVKDSENKKRGRMSRTNECLNVYRISFQSSRVSRTFDNCKWIWCQ